MRSIHMHRLPRLRGDERGVALPLALIGLVSVSILVTTALVTSSTELAISSAHQDATRALYTADGGLQAYVAQNGLNLLGVAGVGEIAYTPPNGGVDEQVQITVSFVGERTLPSDSILRVFAVTAQAVSGGQRAVTTMVRQLIPPPDPADLNITSAMAVAGDLTVNGNAFTVSGASTCGGGGVEALRVALDSNIDLDNDQQYENRIENFEGVNDAGEAVTGAAAIDRGGTRQEMASDILNGKTLAQIANRIPQSNWRYRLNTPTYTTSFLTDKLRINASQPYGGVAVVDAQGGTISVGAGTYHGMLIVLNGSVNLSGGGIVFNGIILAERNFSLSGSVTVNGAIVSLAMDGENVVANTVDDSGMSGAVDVNFNQCVVDDALDAYGHTAPNEKDPVMRPTMAWLEVTG